MKHNVSVRQAINSSSHQISCSPVFVWSVLDSNSLQGCIAMHLRCGELLMITVLYIYIFTSDYCSESYLITSWQISWRLTFWALCLCIICIFISLFIIIIFFFWPSVLNSYYYYYYYYIIIIINEEINVAFSQKTARTHM